MYAAAAAQWEQTHLLPDEATLVAQRLAERAERDRVKLAAAAPAQGYHQPIQPAPAGGDWLGNRGGRDWLGR